MEIGPTTQQVGKFTLHCRKADESYLVFRFKFHQNVNVAIRSKVIPQNRAV